ncbi:helix-turn-helix domain-containing protein [Fictibacillus aquaticus]|uniref:HTH cro/C1-type domain-containing protein n=1 Tax=Fictibacillus aquaticus TaxID=2021314 RepID=A0A235FBP6_9BACL|nr:helix-turn-helix domain-containing protein [Fictibacillus aquaticus]OYD58444.1 hypothetical protein CGZ90_00645 [Fictibacillus aquaticus]
MELQSKVRTLVVDRGYNSLSDFAEKKKVSYYLLRQFAYNRANSLEVKFLIELCSKLDCEISDLMVLKK